MTFLSIGPIECIYALGCADPMGFRYLTYIPVFAFALGGLGVVVLITLVVVILLG